MEHSTSTMRDDVVGGWRRATSAWRATAAQPGWVVRLAVAAFLLVIAIPLGLLLVLALLVASVVFGVLVLANRLVGLVRGDHRDGRENVRVIRRER